MCVYSDRNKKTLKMLNKIEKVKNKFKQQGQESVRHGVTGHVYSALKFVKSTSIS